MSISVTPVGRSRPWGGAFGMAVVVLTATLAACGGSADPPQPAAPVAPPPPVAVAPLITTSPANQTVPAGQTAAFSVVASGTAPLSYQWQRDGAAIAGAVNASYTTPATVAADNAATFSVVVSNSVGNVTSGAATLTVTVPVTLTITLQPASVTVTSGSAASFTVDATCSAGVVAWGWQRSGDGGTTWTNIAGATTASYTLTTAASDNAAQFRAGASCSGQSQNTSAATLTVTAPAAGVTTLSELPIGLAPAAQLSSPAGVVLDGAGVAYLVDSFRNTIRRIATDGTVTTIAGQSSVTGGSTDGTGAAAAFNRPRGIAVGADGTLYVTDTLNHTIRRITAAGAVTTLAGTAGSSGSTDGSGTAARFNLPFGITFGSDGALYVADSANFTIRRVALDGTVTTLAGTAGSSGIADGNGAAARFGLPAGIVGDSSGALYVADQENNTIRKVTIAGATSTIAGNGSTTAADGVGTAAGIPRPGGLALAGGQLYITAFADRISGSNLGQVRLLRLTDGNVVTVAGAGTAAAAAGGQQADGTPGQAIYQFGSYQAGSADAVNRAAVAVAADGVVYVTDPVDDALRTVDVLGFTSTRVYGAIATPNGDGNALPDEAFGDLGLELSLGVDNANHVLVADSGAHDVRSIAVPGAASVVGSVQTIAGLHNRAGQIDAKGTAAQFARPDGVVGTSAGIVFVADTNNSAIRRISADGTVSTYAGMLGVPGSADGAAATARFYQPRGIVLDSAGVLYVADSAGTTIRRVGTDGSVTTIAGAPNTSGFADGTGATARFSQIFGLAIDAAGVIYAADAGNSAIRKISSSGVVTTLAGGPTITGNTTSQGLSNPHGVAVGADGTVYVADTSNNAVRAISPAGVVTTLAGVTADNFTRLGTDSRLGSPTGIAIIDQKTIAVTAARVYGASVFASVYTLTLP
jgi:sugar lactone lactonase YvrE